MVNLVHMPDGGRVEGHIKLVWGVKKSLLGLSSLLEFSQWLHRGFVTGVVLIARSATAKKNKMVK